MFDNYYSAASCANIVGLTASIFFYLRGGDEKYARCITIDQLKMNKDDIPLAKDSNGFLRKFFLGREWNPRIYGVDVKMFLYLVGAVGLECNLLSALFVQLENSNGQISNAMATYFTCFSWFVFEYMYCENVHLYTYDLFAEKIGFKLLWGCLFFYPNFYPIGMFAVAQSHPQTNDLTVSTAASIAGLFFIGWCITRGANMQKYYFRINPTATTCFLGLIKQEALPGTRILISGYWGMARHMNYLGEIIQAVALALPGFLVAKSTADRLIPWLYPVYYVLLFVPRQFDDDAVCKLKYGEKWDEYVKRVPYRIIPGVW